MSESRNAEDAPVIFTTRRVMPPSAILPPPVCSGLALSALAPMQDVTDFFFVNVIAIAKLAWSDAQSIDAVGDFFRDVRLARTEDPGRDETATAVSCHHPQLN